MRAYVEVAKCVTLPSLSRLLTLHIILKMSKYTESYWCTEPSGYVDPRTRSCSSIPSLDKSEDQKNNSEENAKRDSEWEENITPQTIPNFFEECVGQHKDKIAFKQKLQSEHPHHHASYSILRPSNASIQSLPKWKSI